MRPILLATCLSLLALGALAEPDPTPLEFTQLDLLDGRKLRNVVIKSYNEHTDRVLLLADKTAMNIPLGLIPSPFSEQLRIGAPRSNYSSNIQPSMPVLPQPYRRTALRPLSPTYTYSASVPAPTAPPPQDPALASHAAAAMERARQYYLAELRPGSVPSFTQIHQIKLDPPIAITGWAGRCRSQGQAEVEHFARGYRSLGRTISTFEVITEQKPGEPLSVIDFSRKT